LIDYGTYTTVDGLPKFLCGHCVETFAVMSNHVL
jgi:hypothetical protein